MTTTNLSQINREFEEKEAQKKALEKGLPYLDIEKIPINADIVNLWDENLAEKTGALLFRKNGKKLYIALSDTENVEIEKELKNRKDQGYEIITALCSVNGFRTRLDLYQHRLANRKKIELKEEYTASQQNDVEKMQQNFSELEKKIRDLKPQQAIQEIALLAMSLRASDMHFQPGKNGTLVVRFRIDGALYDILKIGSEESGPLINQLKYQANLKVNVVDTPQDGRFSFFANGRHIDVRVSVLPTEFLESAVCRLLDTELGIHQFEELGFDAEMTRKCQSLIDEKSGMVLVTGPTGSGKTTTLYTMLSALNTPEKKIVTLEDPVEYYLSGITQSSVDSRGIYNFENGLKAMLRHDPDVILIGEIREFSTAKLASEAAQTGHIVLSSLHTNSAVGAISRLKNLGLEDYNITGSLKGIIAQRLVRTTCSHCEKEIPLDSETLPKKTKAAIKRLQEKKSAFKTLPKTVKKSVGCDYCSHSGYLGRTAIVEILMMNEVLINAIHKGKIEQEILKIMRNENDFFDFFEDGITKVLLGKTDFEEIYRVA